MDHAERMVGIVGNQKAIQSEGKKFTKRKKLESSGVRARKRANKTVH